MRLSVMGVLGGIVVFWLWCMVSVVLYHTFVITKETLQEPAVITNQVTD